MPCVLSSLQVVSEKTPSWAGATKPHRMSTYINDFLKKAWLLNMETDYIPASNPEGSKAIYGVNHAVDMQSYQFVFNIKEFCYPAASSQRNRPSTSDLIYLDLYCDSTI